MIQDVKKIYLCTPDLKIRTILNGIQTNSVDLHCYVKDYDDLSFNVDRYITIDGVQVESNGYEDLKVYMYLLLEDVGYFQMQAPTLVGDGNYEYKEIQAYSIDKEFEQKDWLGFKVNNGEPDSLEMIARGNVDELGFAKNFVTLYNPEKPELSFVDLMLTKLPGWTVGHIDQVLCNKVIPLIQEDNANIYSIMTSSVAPRLDMIFQFDYLNRKVNGYHKDNLDFDTNIFIGFRNLANEVNITVDEDSVYTRFRVRGEDDLTFVNVNYGNDQVIDLSYFLGEPYMTDELADKIRYWTDERDEQREEYIELEKQAAIKNAVIDSIQYRVPSDDTYWKYWDNKNEEALRSELAVYQAKLLVLKQSVDTRPKEIQYDAYGNYVPPDKTDEEFLDLLWESQNGCGGYYTYKEIITYIIPYINDALSNIALINGGGDPKDKIKYGKESEENWELYGYIELEAKIKSYREDKLPALENFSKKWKELSDEQITGYVTKDGYFTQGRTEYIHILNMLYGYAEDANENSIGGTQANPSPGSMLYQRQILSEKLADAKRELTRVQREIDFITKQVQLETAVDRRGDPLFTKEQLHHIYALLIDTDYTNSNILSTSVDSVTDKLIREQELYDDAVQKLSEVSQPQYTFNVELDNLLRIPEFQGWVEDLRLMRFIRLGVRDDYAVKLRIIEIQYNPCEVDETLTLTFSSMITSKSGRNDLTQIIDNENNRGQKNQISIGKGNSKTANEWAENLLTFMVNNGLFSQTVREISSTVTGDIDRVGVNNAISSYMSNTTYPVSQLTGTSAEFEQLFANGFTAESITSILLNAQEGRFDEVIAKYITADTITTKLIAADDSTFGRVSTRILNAGKATIDDLVAESIESVNISADQITSGTIDTARINVSDVITIGTNQITTIADGVISTAEINADQITSGTISTDLINVNDVITVGTDAITTIAGGAVTTDRVIASLVDASVGDFDTLGADSAFIQYLNSRLIEAGTVSAETVIAALVEADEGNFDQLFAESAFIDYLESNLIVSEAAHISNLTADLATINVADVNQLAADSAFIQSLQALSSTAAQSVITDAHICNVVASNIAVADLLAGDITISDSMRILSKNGKMIMNGNALQILGEDSQGNQYVGVQLGYATNGQPSLVLRNEDGAVIVDPTGITADAVADGLIVNDMISNGTISESKLGFSVVKTTDSISIEKIYTGNGQFGSEWSTFKNDTGTALRQMRTDIEESANYFLYIETPSGTNIRGGNITLNAHLFKNSVEVTDEWDASYFHWERKTNDSYGDANWNSALNTRYPNGTKSITITASDVSIDANFVCYFEIDDLTVTSSNGGE